MNLSPAIIDPKYHFVYESNKRKPKTAPIEIKYEPFTNRLSSRRGDSSAKSSVKQLHYDYADFPINLELYQQLEMRINSSRKNYSGLGATSLSKTADNPEKEYYSPSMRLLQNSPFNKSQINRFNLNYLRPFSTKPSRLLESYCRNHNNHAKNSNSKKINMTPSSPSPFANKQDIEYFFKGGRSKSHQSSDKDNIQQPFVRDFTSYQSNPTFTNDRGVPNYFMTTNSSSDAERVKTTQKSEQMNFNERYEVRKTQEMGVNDQKMEAHHTFNYDFESPIRGSSSYYSDSRIGEKHGSAKWPGLGHFSKGNPQSMRNRQIMNDRFNNHYHHRSNSKGSLELEPSVSMKKQILNNLQSRSHQIKIEGANQFPINVLEVPEEQEQEDCSKNSLEEEIEQKDSEEVKIDDRNIHLLAPFSGKSLNAMPTFGEIGSSPSNSNVQDVMTPIFCRGTDVNLSITGTRKGSDLQASLFQLEKCDSKPLEKSEHSSGVNIQISTQSIKNLNINNFNTYSHAEVNPQKSQSSNSSSTKRRSKIISQQK